MSSRRSYLRITCRATWGVEIDKTPLPSSSSSAAAALASHSTIVAVRVCWQVPSSTTVSANGAPKSLAICLQQSADDGKKLVLVGVVDPEAEFRRQNSWTQTYFLNKNPNGSTGWSNAIAVKLVFSKLASSNTSKRIRMYSVEVLTEDTHWINTLPMLKSVQSALMPLLEFDYLERTVYETTISMVRTTGSLSMAISFVQFIFENQLNMKIKTLASDPLLLLLLSVYSEDTRLRALAENALERVVTDAVFDDGTKSSNVEIGEKGQLLTFTQPAPVTPAVAAVGGEEGHCLLSCLMESGVWTWEISVPPNTLAEDVFFGVAKRPNPLVDPPSNPPSLQRWMRRYRPSDNSGSVSDTLNICRLTFDAEAGTLHMQVRGEDLGIVFDTIPRGVSPLVVFHKKATLVRLITVRHKAVRDENSRAKIRAAPTAADVTGEDVSVVNVVLEHISSLAVAKLEQMASKVVDEEHKSTSLLEFPFCVEVSSSVLSQLFTLLEVLVPSVRTNFSIANTAMASDNDRVTLAILQIVDAQFYCLSRSEIDPSDVGFPYSRTGSGTEKGNKDSDNGKEGIAGMIVYDPILAAPTVQQASRVLTMLRQRGSGPVRSAAAKAFARGAALFLPNIDDKLASTLSILQDVADAGTIDDATLLLLEMLMQRLSHYEEVLQIIELYKKCPLARSMVVDILRNLVRILSRHSILFFSNSEPQSPMCLAHTLVSVNADFRRTVGTLLGRFQEQLVYDIATAASRPPTRNEATSSATTSNQSAIARSLDELLVQVYTNPLIRTPHLILTLLLISILPFEHPSQYHVMLVNESLRVLEAAANAVTTGTITSSLIERNLHGSIVSDLLQPLLHGVVCVGATDSAASSQLNLVSGVLPSTVRLLEGISHLCQSSARCVAATKVGLSSTVNINPWL